jgi:hypothetical protein
MSGAKEILGASKALLEGRIASTFSLDDVRNVLDMTLEAVETNVVAFESSNPANPEKMLVHTRHGLYMTFAMFWAMIFESLPVRGLVELCLCIFCFDVSGQSQQLLGIHTTYVLCFEHVSFKAYSICWTYISP